MKEGNNGVTSKTVQNIQFGAGTIHKGLKYITTDTYVLTTDTEFKAGKTYYTKSGSTYTATTQNVGASVTESTYYEKSASAGTWNFAESCVGATKGGSSLNITPEFYSVQPDGSTVAIKDFKRKVGETAKLDVNLLELTADMMKSAVVGKDGVSADENYSLIESKDSIEEGDYWENIAFVGETLDGKNIIVILDNALCTSGLTIEGKNKEEGVGKYTFECHADASESLTTLPYHIYYPKRTA